MIEGIVDGPHLIWNHASRGYIELRQIDHEVRGSQRPDWPIFFYLRQRIGAAASRRTGFYPMHQRLGLFAGQGSIIAADTIVMIRIPGWHALGSHHLPYYGRESALH